ncbi:hypothetical protein [Minwuia thermotolerans]|uniref:Uncharacterized protein n=1 Tax=Minwuia thermotolerans TaxID=2056226 RepID=A0A2M9G0U4_9PROT|nr:hypothetical protein [Minwuia thermotolerans]PJK29325.1 hypothetical protein CVT23_12025 [Minwuia thermotolerans]PJK30490.1 hypothetical protein CVT23_05970 [Minwuia thermotolerans]PJK30713.1 hypothetical protein CVT23_04920 [Minwuia thermotolerans]
MDPDDLADAFAKIDWADTQIDALDQKLRGFLDQKPYRLRPVPDPEGRGLIYFFKTAAPVPRSIGVQTGAIIHAQRSALDLLACALAERNGHREPSDTYFPFAKSEQGLADKRTRKKFRRLSEADQAAILGFRPFRGGNALLYALHHLDLTDKHRKLLVCGIERGDAHVSGNGHIRLIALWDGPYTDGDPVARWDADEGLQLNITLSVSLADVPDIGRPPVAEMLRKFSEMTRSILESFQ